MPWYELKPPEHYCAEHWPRPGSIAIGIGSIWECPCGKRFQVVDKDGDKTITWRGYPAKQWGSIL